HWRREHGGKSMGDRCGRRGRGVRKSADLHGALADERSGSPGTVARQMEEENVMSGWEELPRMLLSLVVAFVLGIPIGWNRERQEFGPGLRTFPLLAMGACAYLEIGQFAFRGHLDGQARVFQALVSGIGFIGAGAIIKGPVEVHGLA